MKTKLLLLFILLFLSNSLIAQDQELLEQIKSLKTETVNNFNTLSDGLTKLKSELDLTNLEIKNAKNVIKNAKNVIKTKTNLDISLVKDQVAEKEHYIIQTSEFIRTASKSFRAIDASLAQSAYLNDVITLNNPTNDDLGFSLQSITDNLIKEHILSKDKGLSRAGKVNNFVDSLIENPIADIVKSAIPAINTVISFISNLSFGSKKITPEDFKNFTEALKKYVEHYEGLADATKEYESNLQQIQIRVAALEIYLEAFAIERMSNLHTEDWIFKQKNVLSFNELLRKYYSDDVIRTKLDGVTENKLDNIKYNYPITSLNRSRYILDELESLSNQYIRANDKYYNK